MIASAEALRNYVLLIACDHAMHGQLVMRCIGRATELVAMAANMGTGNV